MKITTELNALHLVPSETKPTVNIRMTISNDSNRDIVLRFNSGQQFDIILRSAEGDEIRRWSDDMMFMQMLNETIISPNSSETFAGDLLLLDRQEQPLPIGSYLLEFELKGSPAPDAGAFKTTTIKSILPLFIDQRMRAS
ncbi:BsuPI-related putative proteinase inhibitor [Permianibacter aggregans]|uniref:Intracellular proteinase inhibitor BsuPI n=1 Tax=Permianibacter aggregans TaxID=1510150 RepID=A0A4R6UTA2_9GAMM|nr:BsuPI-related putative proteinase inhibitor [Permianibacter aggregans]QGX38251.1 hypothetical protein E2H98_00625 [Permianibacter aggregans]TDQ48565.1 intracellular proteinase inhibitor BsuPI [Permianibacter aggregans]